MASSLFDSPPAVRLAAASAATALTVAALISGVTAGGKTLRLVLFCFGGGMLIPFLLSFFRPEIFLWYRYPVVLFPLWCAAAGGAAVQAGPLVYGGNRAVRALARWWGPAACALLVLAGLAGTVRYYSWQKSNVREVAFYADSLSGTGAKILIRPRTFAPLLNYYSRAEGVVQYDETYLDQPLGTLVDTASAFIYVSLDVPNGIREYMDGHFVKAAERHFPGEAHMGMVVTLYRQPPDEDAR
jgi:hypothetical protein